MAICMWNITKKVLHNINTGIRNEHKNMNENTNGDTNRNTSMNTDDVVLNCIVLTVNTDGNANIVCGRGLCVVP